MQERNQVLRRSAFRTMISSKESIEMEMVLESGSFTQQFTANLRLPDSLNSEEIRRRIEAVANSLELSDNMDTCEFLQEKRCSLFLRSICCLLRLSVLSFWLISDGRCAGGRLVWRREEKGQHRL